MKKMFLFIAIFVSISVKAQFYYPMPQQGVPQIQWNFSQPKAPKIQWHFESNPQSTPVQQYNNYNNIESNTSSQQQQSQQAITKTCGVCHGTGTCNNCGGKGWVSRMGMGKDGPCPVCPNHNGRCSSCGGRGSWKEYR